MVDILKVCLSDIQTRSFKEDVTVHILIWCKTTAFKSLILIFSSVLHLSCCLSSKKYIKMIYLYLDIAY